MSPMGIRCNGGGRKINLKLTISFLLPAILTLVLMIACGGISESDIEATVEARVTEERATEATVEARAQAIAKAMVAATAEAAPTAKPVPPTATPTLVPTTPTPAQVQVITPLPGQPFVVENEATAGAFRGKPTTRENARYGMGKDRHGDSNEIQKSLICRILYTLYSAFLFLFLSSWDTRYL